MQFIEHLLGVSPDGGTGMTEVAIVAAVVWGVLLVLARKVAPGRDTAAQR